MYLLIYGSPHDNYITFGNAEKCFQILKKLSIETW